MTKQFDANRQEVRAEINKKLDEATKAKEAGTLSNTEFEKQQKKLQNLGLLVDSISTGLSAPTSSGLGIAAATLSPKLSYEIGQYFKAKDSEGSTAHILAHTVLGAAVAAVGGNDALTAGLSAGGAETAAPLLSKYLYGKEAKDLTADEKGTVSAITGLVASGIGASTGDVASTVQSGQSAQNAVENNEFSIVTDATNKLAAKKNEKNKNECKSMGINPNSSACGQYHDKKLRKDISDASGTASNISTILGLYPTPASPVLLSAGALLGTGSTLLDDTKSNNQKFAEIVISSAAGGIAGKVVKNAPVSEGIKNIYTEGVGKTAEQIPEAIKQCQENPKKIGC